MNQQELRNINAVLRDFYLESVGKEWQDTFEGIINGVCRLSYKDKNIEWEFMPTNARLNEFKSFFELDQSREGEEELLPLLLLQTIYTPLIKLEESLAAVSDKLQAGALVNSSDVAHQDGLSVSFKNWRLHMDPCHQKFGPTAYDAGGAATEDEFQEKSAYMQNMQKVEDRLNEHFLKDDEINLELYKEIHDLAVEDAKKEILQTSSFRSAGMPVISVTGRFGQIHAAMFQAALMEDTTLGSEKLIPADYGFETTPAIEKLEEKLNNGGFFACGLQGQHYTPVGDFTSIEKHLTGWFAEYNQKIQQANKDQDQDQDQDQDKLEIIVTLFQRLEKEHPFPDGNGRINRALLNALLIKNNFRPTLLYDSACAHFLKAEQLIDAIKKGQEAFEIVSRDSDSSWREVNSALIQWEKNNQIQLEYSLEHGQYLQGLWQSLNKSHAALSKIIKMHELVEKWSEKLPSCIKQRFKDLLNGDNIEIVVRNFKLALNELTQFFDKPPHECPPHGYNEPEEIVRLREQALTYQKDLVSEVEALIKSKPMLHDSTVPNLHEITDDNVGLLLDDCRQYLEKQSVELPGSRKVLQDTAISSTNICNNNRLFSKVDSRAFERHNVRNPGYTCT